MGKTEVENLDLKSKLNIVSGTMANAKKNLESLKTEINDVKSDYAMSNNLTDNLTKIDNDILMTKNEYYINIRNKGHIINNDMLVNKTKCIKLKSVIQEKINSLKNILNIIFITLKKTPIAFQ